MRKIRPWELIAAIALVGLLAAVFLPALARSRESSRRSSCQNNLKQMGLVIKMYSNESRGMLYPPVSPVPGNWTFDMTALYPEYLTDPSILRCPNSPHFDAATFTLKSNLEHPGAQIGDFHPDCVSSMFYIYTGYELLCDRQAQALADARAALPEDWFGDTDIQVPLGNTTSSAPVDAASAQNDPSTGAAYQAQIPIVWDRIGTKTEDSNHVPRGSNVLYADGHVEFGAYSHYNGPDAFPVTSVSASTFGDSVPVLSRDCYE